MVAVSGGFLIFTNNGYGFVDITNPASASFAETSNLDLKQSKKTYLIGNRLYIGGPSKVAGKAKIARLNIASPNSPIVDFIDDQITGNFSDFSFDGVDGYYLKTDELIALYQESGISLALKQSAVFATFPNSVTNFYAYKGRFYFGQNGVNIYKLP